VGYDARKIENHAATIRDLEDLGAVLLTRSRTIGFERRRMSSRTAARPTSPGAGGSARSGFYDDEPWDRARH
jgi:hypothetical protein